MKKVFWKSGNFLIVEDGIAWEYENDPDWDRTEDVKTAESIAQWAVSVRYSNPGEGQRITDVEFYQTIRDGINELISDLTPIS